MILSSLTICYNERFYIEMMLQSCKEIFDEIVIVDGFSNDGTYEYLLEEAKTDKRIKVFQHKGANPKTIHFGQARQYAQEQITGDWTFIIDADECLQDCAKELLLDATKNNIDFYDVQMIHFIENFSKIDASVPIHFGIFRFYKNYSDIRLDNIKNHALPNSKNFKRKGLLFQPILFHCGYLNGMTKIFERYWRNIQQGCFHQPYYNTFWKEWHYRGEYPTKQFDYNMMPSAIKDRFHFGDFSHWSSAEKWEENV